MNSTGNRARIPGSGPGGNIDASLNTRPDSRQFDPSLNQRGFDASVNRRFDGPLNRGPGATFGNNTNAFGSGSSTGTIRPGAAIPGAANRSGGSASAMFRPGAQSIGDANQAGAARAAFQGNAPFDAATNADVANFGAANPAAANAAAAAAAARGTIAPQQPNADLAPITPSIEASPTAPVAPILPITPSVPVGDPRATLEPLITPDGDVSAAAASRSDLPAVDVRRRVDWARATAVPGSDSVTVTDERGETAGLPSPAETAARSIPIRANYRGPVNTEASQYRLWDGYHWYLSPASGWHYWDGEDGRGSGRCQPGVMTLCVCCPSSGAETVTAK